MTISLSLTLTSLLAAASFHDAPPHVGSWAGWMYLDDGDVPVRVHIDETSQARIDLPVAGQFGAAFELDTSATTLTLSYPQRAAAEISLTLELESAGHFVGEVRWGDVGGVVELHAAAEVLVPQGRHDLDCVGVYGTSGGSARIVRTQPWGELILVDAATGAERTLFPLADERYAIGPALYVPAPVERLVRFERDVDTSVLALVEEIDGQQTRHARRTLRREELAVTRDDVTLVGTLYLGDHADAPCAIVAGGSGWTDRTRVEEVAMRLVAQGLHAVIYDKRGWGESGGERDVPFATTAADLRAFADLARRHDVAGARAVGYVGLSRGGWYGALAAAEDDDAAFFVSVVGPAVSPIEQETTARLDRMRGGGATDEHVTLGRRYLEAMWHFARTGSEGERYLELRGVVEPTGWLGELHGPRDLAPDAWRWLRLNGDFDPIPTLRALACPTLAVYGSEDLAVASRINAPLMRDALDSSEASPRDVVVLPGCDHALAIVERTDDGTRLPFHRRKGRHPDAWSTIGGFLRERTERRSEPR